MDQDRKIVEAIIEGNNNAALQLLYTSSLPVIRKYITMNNGTEHDANDIFQDAVIILMRQIKYGKFEMDKSVGGFLYTVARNLWINKAVRDKKRVLVDEIPEDSDIQNDIQVNSELKERESTIKSILNKLGETCAKILKAITFEGLDYKEIAHNTGLASSDVVKTYKNRCKKKLVGLLAENKNLRNELLRHEQGFRAYIKVD
jgi:RNA polymerase sigma factor (sigma-70 family)